MAERRAELVVDIRVGEINVGGGPVRIPARLDVQGGGGGGTTSGGAGTPVGGAVPRPPRPPGTGWRWNGSSWVMPPPPPPTGGLGGAAGRLGGAAGRAAAAAAPYAAAFTAAAAAVIPAVVVGMGILNRLTAVFVVGLRVIGVVGKAAFGALLALVKGLAAGFYTLARGAISLTVAAIERLARAAAQAGAALWRMGSGFVKNAVGVFADFEQELQNTVTVMGVYGAAAQKMRGDLTAALNGITQSSRRSMTEAASAAYDVASAGFSTLQQVTEMTRASIVLSEATLYDLKGTAEVLMATLLQFRLGTDQAMRAANAMAAQIALTPSDMPKLAGALRYAGTMAAMFGESLEGTLASVGALFLVGRKATQAGMEIANVYNSLVKVSTRGAEVLKGIGLTPQQINPAYNRLVDIVALFEKAQQQFGQGKVAEVITSVFTLRAARGLMGLLAVGSARMRELERDVTGTNTALKMQQDQIKTLAGRWKQVQNTWEKAKIAFATGASTTLTPALEVLNRFISRLVDSGVFAWFGKLAGYIGGVLVDALIKLEPAIEWTLGFIGGYLSVALPRIMSQLVALVPIVIQIGDAFVRLLPSLEPLLIGLLDFALKVAPVLVEVAQTVLPPLVTAFANLAEAVGAFVSDNAGMIGDWFKMVAGFIAEVQTSLPTLGPLLLDLAQALMNLLPQIMEAASSALPQLVDAIRTVIPDVGALLILLIQGATQILPALITMFGQLAGEVLPGVIFNVAAFVQIVTNNFPLLQEIVSKAANVMGAVLKSFGLGMGELSGTISDGLQWISDNFYALADTALGVIDTLLGAFQVAAMMLGPIIALQVAKATPELMKFALAISVVAGDLLILQEIALGLAKAMSAMWPTAENAARVENLAKDVQNTKDLLGGMWTGVGMLMRAPLEAQKLGSEGAEAIKAVRGNIQGARTDVQAMRAADEQRRQSRPVPTGTTGYSPTGNGYSPTLTPAGYTGTPAGYNTTASYSVGPFYVNSLEAMKQVFDQRYAELKAQEAGRDRLRAPGGAY